MLHRLDGGSVRQAVPSLSNGRQREDRESSGAAASRQQARREGREAASSAHSKVCARFSLTLSCLQVVTKAELPADCGVRPEPGGEGTCFSLSDFLELAEVFVLCLSERVSWGGFPAGLLSGTMARCYFLPEPSG